MALDVDFVSDLNGTGEATVAVNANDTSVHGDDVVSVNNQRPVAETPKKVDTVKVDDAEKPKALSLRDQISSAIKGEGDTPDAASKDGVNRNPDGTFAPKAADVPAADAAPVDPNAAKPAEAAPVVAAPQGINPEVFKSLPAETQVELARTMDGIAQSQQRFARLGEVEQLIAPRLDAWALNGMTPASALNQLLALSDFAGRDPGGFIKYMAENNGVDLEELVLGSEPVDPTVAALQREIAELKNGQQSFTQQQQQAAHQAVVDNVIAFASEKDQSGKLVRPYFEELSNDIMPVIAAVKAQNPNWSHTQVLQKAYENACWVNEGVRGKMQAAAQAAAEAERLRQGAEKVERARSASASVPNGAPTGSTTPPPGSGSLRDTIRQSIASLS